MFLELKINKESPKTPSQEAGQSVPLGSVCGRQGRKGEGWHSSGPTWTTASVSLNLSPVDKHNTHQKKGDFTTGSENNLSTVTAAKLFSMNMSFEMKAATFPRGGGCTVALQRRWQLPLGFSSVKWLWQIHLAQQRKFCSSVLTRWPEPSHSHAAQVTLVQVFHISPHGTHR